MAVVRDYDVTYKILVLGDSGVGKTCLIRRFTDDDFTDSFLSTIGKVSLFDLPAEPFISWKILNRKSNLKDLELLKKSANSFKLLCCFLCRNI